METAQNQMGAEDTPAQIFIYNAHRLRSGVPQAALDAASRPPHPVGASHPGSNLAPLPPVC